MFDKMNKILQGDALTQLKTLQEKSINICMTSPPYWALRDYGVDGQLGLEPTFDQYISNLCDIFDEVKRVLRDDGTYWVNMGDTYGGSGCGTNDYYTEASKSIQGKGKNVKLCKTGGIAQKIDYPAKSLCCIPFRFVLEMINRGWILRNTIIWHKPNCMPSSVKDRFTVDFEYVFFFSKKKKYYFETQYESFRSNDHDKKRMQEPRKEYAGKWSGKKDHESYGSPRVRTQRSAVPNTQRAFVDGNKQGRNKRTVWRICPKPFKEAHFAVYPEELCETPIRAGCPEGGIVLDPFFGAGTTGLVALKQNKKFLGIELNPEYIKIAKARLKPFLEQQILPK